MSKCDNCRLRKESAKAFDIHWLGEDDCPYDQCPVPNTNADRIRAMSDEELADFLLKVLVAGVKLANSEDEWKTVFDGYKTPCEWLKQEVKE